MSLPSAGRLVTWAAVLPVLAVPIAYGEGLTREYLAAKTFAALTASVALAAAGACLAGAREAGRWRPDRSGVYPVALVLLSWAGISLFWHEHRWSAAEPLVHAMLLVAGSWGLSRLLPDRRFRGVFLALYGVACAVAAIAYLVSFRVGPHGPGYDFPFGNANVAAGFLLVPAVAAATFCADLRRRRRGAGTAISFAVLAALVAAIVRSEAKAAWLGGLAGAWLGIFLVSGPRGRKASAVLAFAAVLFLVLVFTLVPARRADLADSIDVRIDIWRGTWRMISEGPIPIFAGRGPGSFLVEFPRHEPIESDAHRMWASDTEDPHSLPLAIWCEVGLFGLVVFAALLATGGAAALSSLSRTAEPFDRASLAAAAGSLLAFVLAGSVDVAPHYAPVAMNAWIAVALLVAAARTPRGPREDLPDPPSAIRSPQSIGPLLPPPPPRPRRVAAGVRFSGAAVLAALWWLGPRAEFASELAGHRAHEAAEEGRAAAREGDIESAREALERALSECDGALAGSPWEAYRTLVLRRERVHLLLELAALPDSPDRRRAVARDAYRAAQALGGEDGLAPGWGLVELDLALCAFVMGNHDRARQHVAAGWRARPLQWRYYDFYLANLDRPDQRAMRADLAANLARGLAIAPDSFPLVAVLGLLSSSEGEPSAAATLERAERLGEAALAGPLTRDRKNDYQELLARVREAR